jgi:hypothetical protein
MMIGPTLAGFDRLLAAKIDQSARR